MRAEQARSWNRHLPQLPNSRSCPVEPLSTFNSQMDIAVLHALTSFALVAEGFRGRPPVERLYRPRTGADRFGADNVVGALQHFLVI